MKRFYAGIIIRIPLVAENMQTNGFVHSFSRKGNPYDNACIESFHSIMKKEEIYLHTYQDFEECRKALFEYIESWYNRQRQDIYTSLFEDQNKYNAIMGALAEIIYREMRKKK